jgi:hypothetical protein
MQESVHHSLPPFRTLIQSIIVGIKVIHLASEASETHLPMQVPLPENCDILNYICSVTRDLRTGVASSLIFMQVRILRHKRYIPGMRGVARNVHLKTCLLHLPFIWGRVCIVHLILSIALFELLFGHLNLSHISTHNLCITGTMSTQLEMVTTNLKRLALGSPFLLSAAGLLVIVSFIHFLLNRPRKLDLPIVGNPGEIDHREVLIEGTAKV